MRKLSRAASLAVATATLAVAVPGGISAAQVVAPKPDLKTLVAQAKQLEFQINSLSEQYDGLRIQLTRAKANAQIAQQLVVSEKTVDHHVSAILRKLAVHTRGEAGAEAARLGLISPT